MPLLTTLIFGIGPSVAKALLKSVLRDHPLIGDIAPDLLNMLRDSAKGECTRREESGPIAAIGESVATRLSPLFDDARLTDAERAAVLREVLLTLGQTDAEQMVESRVDPRRLREALLASRPDATRALSARETELYQRAIAEASPALTAIAAELCGYDSLRVAALLQGQDDSAERDERILAAIEALLRKPDEAGERFDQLYRDALKDKLDRLELFGVRRLTAAMKRQRLNVAYVTVQVDRGSARGADDEAKHALHHALAEAARAQPATADERGQSGPIDEVLASERRIVVRGDPGSGKTTLLQWIAVNAAAQRLRGARQDIANLRQL